MALVGLPIQFKKMYAGPLTDDQLFESMEEALAFASGNQAYPGAPVSIKEVIDGVAVYRLYMVQEDKTLSLVGTGNSSSDLQVLVNQVAALEEKLNQTNQTVVNLTSRVETNENNIAALQQDMQEVASALSWSTI